MKNSLMRRAMTATMLGVLVGTAGRAEAGTIISVLGQDNGGLVVGGLSSNPYSQVVATTWSQTQSYTGVYISVSLMDKADDTVDAYLMRGSVPQPSSSQVASTSFQVYSTAGALNYLVFSNLTLTAGTYSLVLYSTTSGFSDLGWVYSASPTIVEDTGVTQIVPTSGSVVASPPPYPPDSPSSFTDYTTASLNFAVTGTLASVPEPSSLVLAGLSGLYGLGWAWRRRRRLRRSGAARGFRNRFDS